MTLNDDILNRIKQIKTKYAPDRRVVVFDINISDDNMTLEGETSCYEAFELLQKLTSNKMKNNIKLLPSSQLEDKTYGIIYNSMGTIHGRAVYSSETVTQTLMGTPVRILDKKEAWYRIQTPDKYIGWINGAVEPMTKDEQTEYLSKPMLFVTSLFANSYQQLGTSSLVVSDLVIGNILAVVEEGCDFFQVQYADGRKAFVEKKDAVMLNNWQPLQTKDSIVETSKRFLGIPYVWGGTSSKGLDCSGFSKTVYFLHNIILPRDASQQVNIGQLVDDNGDFSKIEPGDLVFFGEKPTEDNPKEKVVHVGIYIGDYRFIHASDYIRINSFNPNDPLYDKFNTDRYLRTKRILGEHNLQSVRNIYT